MEGPHIEEIISDPITTKSSLKMKLKQLLDGLWPGDQHSADDDGGGGHGGVGDKVVDVMNEALKNDRSLQQKLIRAAAFVADELEEGGFERKRVNERIILSFTGTGPTCGPHLQGKNGSTEKVEPESLRYRNNNLKLIILTEELDITNRITRLLQLKLPPEESKPKGETDKENGVVGRHSMPSLQKISEDLPWSTFWMSSADIMLHIFRHRAVLSPQTSAEMKCVSDSKFFEACLKFLKGEHSMLAAVCMSHCVNQVLEHCKDRSLGNRFIYNIGVPLCGEYLNKDHGVKQFMDWWKSKKVHLWEENALYHRWEMYYQPFCGVPKHLYGREKTAENAKEFLVHWGKAMASNCARMLGLIAERGPDNCRTIMLKNRTLVKGMMFWFRCPIIVQSDMDVICGCARLVANLCLNETISLYFIREHQILSLLEVHIFCPQYQNLIQYLRVTERLASHEGLCRDCVSMNRVIVTALLNYCGSYEKEVAIHATKAVTHLLTGPTAKAVIDCGFNIRTLIIWNDYNFHHELCEQWGHMKTAVKNSGIREWISQETRLKGHKAMATNTFDESEAMSRKEYGNVAFKRQDYKKALSHYMEALKYCPPSKQNIPCISLHYENVGQCRGHECNCTYGLWTPLPAQLYSNRAQCYLKLGKYKEAVESCDLAVARCLEDIPEAKELLMKSIYRRARACLEVGDLKKAMSDAGYQNLHGGTEKSDPDSLIPKLFDEVFFKFREVHGYHFVRRCFVCLKGEGEKLKRCANCEELYCSKACQLYDWQRRHKNTCHGRKKKKLDECVGTTVAEATSSSRGPITEELD